MLRSMVTFLAYWLAIELAIVLPVMAINWFTKQRFAKQDMSNGWQPIGSIPPPPPLPPPPPKKP